MFKTTTAKHPKTGREIKILQTETHVSRNQKTLVWLRNAHHATPKIQRWEGLVTSLQSYKQFQEKQIQPLYIILQEVSQEVQEWLKAEEPANLLLCFVARDNLQAVGVETIRSLGHQNIIALEEMLRLYPQLQQEYEPEEPISRSVIRVATIMQKQRLFGLTQEELSENEDYLKTIQSFGLDISPNTPMPSKHILIQQYYKSDKPRRYREIKKCLQENLKNPYIDEIWLLNEQSYKSEYPQDPENKIHEVVIQKRLTYADVVKCIQNQIPPNTIVSFANSDIYYDGPSMRALWSMDLTDTFLALLRYEESTDPEKPAQLFGPRADSQDAWITWSTSVQAKQWDFQDIDFPFGQGGCDNAITLCFFRQKFRVANPALTLKTYHVHASEVRNYDKQDIVQRNYMHIIPSGLSDMNPMIDLTPYKSATVPALKPASFSRRIHCYNNAHLQSFCTTLDKKERKTLADGSQDTAPRVYNPDAENTWTSPSSQPVYQYTNTFMTNTGLPYLYGKIPLGNHETLKKAWSETQVSIIQPTLRTESNVIGVYLSQELLKNPYAYFLQYIGQVLHLQQQQNIKGEFWLPRSSQPIQALVQQCKWANQQIPVLPYQENTQVYAASATQVIPLPENPITQEMVAALRKAYIGYRETVDEDVRAVILQDDAGIDVRDMAALEQKLEAMGIQVDVVYPKSSDPTYLFQKLFGAKYVIVANDATTQYENMYWALPQGANLLEIQQELTPRSAGIHVAGAAGLQYWHVAMIRGSKDAVRETLVKRILATIEASKTTPSISSSTPLLILPEGQTGLHAHAGDSFREIAEIWAERGYVTLKKSPHTPFCWLNNIGETLLYDRPNYNWYNATPTPYKKALVGNPVPASPLQDALPWSFWPRKPRYVEALVAAGIANTQYVNRPKNCVFYGKIENATQAQKRTTQDWAQVCDEWFMAQDTTTPYKYTQEEYLRNLASAKYGLCLSGYGPKCHREVECMAMGTVPIVAPEVDMESYANPPVEGVHYLRAATPQQAKELLKFQTQAQWERMSNACKAWWKANASAEGMWNLTKQLQGIE